MLRGMAKGNHCCEAQARAQEETGMLGLRTRLPPCSLIDKIRSSLKINYVAVTHPALASQKINCDVWKNSGSLLDSTA